MSLFIRYQLYTNLLTIRYKVIRYKLSYQLFVISNQTNFKIIIIII